MPRNNCAAAYTGWDRNFYALTNQGVSVIPCPVWDVPFLLRIARIENLLPYGARPVRIAQALGDDAFD
jgi:hypothetical protein